MILILVLQANRGTRDNRRIGKDRRLNMGFLR